MLKKKKHWGIMYLNFLMFFLTLTLFGGSGISLKLFGAVPILILSLLVSYSSFNSLTASAAVGFISGAALDRISADSYCFNTLALLILAVGANLLADHVFNRNLKATIVLCFISAVLYYIFYWLLFISFSLPPKESVTYFISWVLPSCLYTAVLTIPFYFIYKFFKKIKDEN